MSNWLTEKIDPKKEKEIFTEIGTKILEKLGCEKALTEKSICSKIGFCVLKIIEKQITGPLVHVKIPYSVTKEQRNSLEKSLNKLDVQWILTPEDISIDSSQKTTIESISLKPKKHWWQKKVAI